MNVRMDGDGYKDRWLIISSNNSEYVFHWSEKTDIFSCGCHTASGLTSCMPECNSSIRHNYVSTRQRAGKLLHIWACVFQRSATMTADVGCGCNKAPWALSALIGEEEWRKKKERGVNTENKRATEAVYKGARAATGPWMANITQLLHCHPSVQTWQAPP